MRRFMLGFWILCLGPCLMGAGVHAQPRQYPLDQTAGQVGFNIRYGAMFDVEGRFQRFSGTMTLDPAYPERTQVDVRIDTRSVQMSWPEGTELLQSPPHLDVARYPEAHFRSTQIVRVDRNHYRVQGMLDMRGVTRPVELDAQLVDRPANTQSGQAALNLAGSLRRSDFGMTAEQITLSDAITLKISLRLPVAIAADMR